MLDGGSVIVGIHRTHLTHKRAFWIAYNAVSMRPTCEINILVNITIAADEKVRRISPGIGERIVYAPPGTNADMIHDRYRAMIPACSVVRNGFLFDGKHSALLVVRFAIIVFGFLYVRLIDPTFNEDIHPRRYAGHGHVDDRHPLIHSAVNIKRAGEEQDSGNDVHDKRCE